MKLYIYFIIFILFFTSFTTHAKPVGSKIIEIKRTLSLTNSKNHYKDFYIDAGKDKGLKENHIIPVVRRKSFYDPLMNKNIGDLWLPVGDVKIIHVGDKLSVARIYKVPERKKLPEVEYPTFMIGDRILTKKARFISKKKSKSKVKKLKKKYSKKNSKRGVASIPDQKSLRKQMSKKLKSKYSFSEKLRDEINKPTNLNSKGRAGGSSASRPYRLIEDN